MRRNSGEKGLTAQELADALSPFISGGGLVVQSDILSDRTFVSLAGVTIPADGSVPQITEGGQILGPLSYTPLDASNKLQIQINLMWAANATNRLVVALFDGNADSIYSVQQRIHTAAQPDYNSYTTEIIAGSVNARSYTVRVGGNIATTIGRNGVAGAASAVVESSIIITELEP